MTIHEVVSELISEIMLRISDREIDPSEDLTQEELESLMDLALLYAEDYRVAGIALYRAITATDLRISK